MGQGFLRGAYTCVCNPGTSYPIEIKPPFRGENLEQATLEEYKAGFDCHPTDCKFRIHIRIYFFKQVMGRHRIIYFTRLGSVAILCTIAKLLSSQPTGRYLAMFLGTDVRLESPNPTPFIYLSKAKEKYRGLFETRKSETKQVQE